MGVVISQMKRDADVWANHYSKNGTAPIWERIATNLADSGVEDQVATLESDVVQAANNRSQPVTPYWTEIIIMLGNYAEGTAELKVFLSTGRSMEWQVLVPEAWWNWQLSDGGRCAADRSQDYPVVVKVYSIVHASVMTINEIEIDGTMMSFDENLSEVSNATWKGLWLRDSLAMQSHVMPFFKMKVILARKMVDVLQRARVHQLPIDVVQYGVPLRYGEDLMKGRVAGEVQEVDLNGSVDPLTGLLVGQQVDDEKLMQKNEEALQARLAVSSLMNWAEEEMMNNVKMGAAVMTSSLAEEDESIHIHVQCRHGFVLISGERDISLTFL